MSPAFTATDGRADASSDTFMRGRTATVVTSPIPALYTTSCASPLPSLSRAAATRSHAHADAQTQDGSSTESRSRVSRTHASTFQAHAEQSRAEPSVRDHTHPSDGAKASYSRMRAHASAIAPAAWAVQSPRAQVLVQRASAAIRRRRRPCAQSVRVGHAPHRIEVPERPRRSLPACAPVPRQCVRAGERSWRRRGVSTHVGDGTCH